MFFLMWIIVWLFLNFIFWWFEFSTLLCFFAGLFLIMPLLTKFSFDELKYVLRHKKALFFSILLNFIIFPIIAFLIGYFLFQDNHYLIAWLILLSLIPWWWLLMSWLQHSKADLKLWFSIFAVNLFLFSIAYLWFSVFVDNFVVINHHNNIENTNNNKKNFFIWSDNFSKIHITYNKNKSNNWSCVIWEVSQKIWADLSCFSSEETKTFIYWIYWFIVLIFLPFLISRWIRKVTILNKFFNKYWNYISKWSAFLIVSYIFSLKYVRQLSEIDLNFLYKLVLAVFLLYITMFILSFIFYKLSSLELKEKKSIFWNSFIRFITLSFILSFLYAIAWNYPKLILIFIIAYAMQILLALVISKFILK